MEESDYACSGKTPESLGPTVTLSAHSIPNPSHPLTH